MVERNRVVPWGNQDRPQVVDRLANLGHRDSQHKLDLNSKKPHRSETFGPVSLRGLFRILSGIDETSK